MLTVNKSHWPLIAASLWVLLIYGAFFLRMGSPLEFPSSFFKGAGGDGSAGFSYWLGSLRVLGAGCLVFGIFWSLGRRVRAWAGLQAPPVMGYCLDLGFGALLLNLLWTGLGFVRLWSDPLWLTSFVGLTLLFLKDLLGLGKKGFDGKRQEGIPLWCSAVITAYLSFLVPHAFLPETFYDSLNYFLGMPAYWLFHQGIVDEPGHILSGYFHGGSLFFLNGFILAQTEGAKVLGVLVLGWILLTVHGWGKELGGNWAGAVAAAAAVSFPLLYLNAFDVRVDALLSLLLLLSGYCLWKAFSTEGEGWPLACALFAGFALTVKPTAGVLALSALLAFLWTRGRPSLPWIKMAFLSGVQVVPWLLKNHSFTGNPFYPYAVSWWGGRSFPQASQERLLHENQRFLPMDEGLGSFLDLPWRLTMPGAGDDQFLGPLMLAFLPLLFLLPERRSSILFLRRTLGFSLVGNLLLSHMLRFSLPSFLLALLLVPAALASLGQGWRRLWSAAVGTGALLCFGSFFHMSSVNFDGMALWAGKEDQQAYLERKLENSYAAAARWAGEELPKDSRLLLVGDSRGVHWPRPFLAQSVFDEPFFAAAAREEGTEDGILRRLREAGVTHLAVNLEEGRRNSMEYKQFDLTKAQWERITRFTARHLRYRTTQGPVLVFEVSPYAGSGEGTPNPFSFFSPEAHAYLQAVGRGDGASSREELSKLLALFPEERYWLGQRARLEREP